MSRIFRALIILLATLLASVVVANNSGPARAELEGFTSDLKNFKADFTQTVKSQDGRVQDETRGQVWLQNPDKLRWVYSGDFPEVIVADGLNIWIYDESLDQVTVKPQSEDAADSPLMLLADVSKLDEQFKVTELGDFDEMFLLELRSLDTESEFERILIGLDSTGIRMMAMEDAFGQRTEIQFANTSKNAQLDPQLFTFQPPASADLVGVAVLPDLTHIK
jgi:outer membrane lipoprotein carrier protein